jgi:hypothetical protein
LVIAFIFLAAIVAVAVPVVLVIRRKSKEYPIPTLAQQARCFAIVWDLYDVPDSARPPMIRWVCGDLLNCYGGRGWTVIGGTCVAGVSWQDQNTCAVAWPPGTKKLSDTAFAHELWHAATWVLGGIDPDHTGPGFAPGGQVEQANKALKERGL